MKIFDDKLNISISILGFIYFIFLFLNILENIFIIGNGSHIILWFSFLFLYYCIHGRVGNMKDFISIKDLTKEEVLEVLNLALELSENPEPELISGKIVGSLFFEPSTRTRLSFTSADTELVEKF